MSVCSADIPGIQLNLQVPLSPRGQGGGHLNKSDVRNILQNLFTIFTLLRNALARNFNISLLDVSFDIEVDTSF